MLARLIATRYDRPSTSGRTRPIFGVGNGADGVEVEVVLKASGGCDRGVGALACEILAACLAADLGLPVPQPFLVEITPEWIAIVPDEDLRAILTRSSPLAFGSRRVGPGFAAWSSGTRLGPASSPTAAAILAFDAFVQNVDRRSGNPNLLVRGDTLRVIDHELAFSHQMLIGWRPPWTLGGLQSIAQPGAHVLLPTVRRTCPDWAPVHAAWAGLADAQLEAYRMALPPEWGAARPLVDDACDLIANLRDRIDRCLAELQRVLT